MCQAYPLSASKGQHYVFLEQYFSLTTLGSGWGPACMACSAKEWMLSDAESSPLSSSLFAITLYWHLSQKWTSALLLSGCSAGCLLHISFTRWLILYKREGVGRTFDWNRSPSSDSGGWRPCDLHFWRPDSPSTLQGYWLWLPGTPRRPSAWPWNTQTCTGLNEKTTTLN